MAPEIAVFIRTSKVVWPPDRLIASNVVWPRVRPSSFGYGGVAPLPACGTDAKFCC